MVWHRCPKEKNGTAQLERNCHAIPAGFVKINLFTDHSDHTIARNGYEFIMTLSMISSTKWLFLLFSLYTLVQRIALVLALLATLVILKQTIWFGSGVAIYCIELRDIVLIFILNCIVLYYLDLADCPTTKISC